MKPFVKFISGLSAAALVATLFVVPATAEPQAPTAVDAPTTAVEAPTTTVDAPTTTVDVPTTVDAPTRNQDKDAASTTQKPAPETTLSAPQESPPDTPDSGDLSALNDYLFVDGGVDTSVAVSAPPRDGTILFRVTSTTHQEIDHLVEQVPGARLVLKNPVFSAADVPLVELETFTEVVAQGNLKSIVVDTKVEKTSFYPSDPHWRGYWGARSAFMPQAWGITRGSPNVKIAILDTGVVLNSELPASRVLSGKTFYPTHPARVTSPSASDRNHDMHGTLSAVVAAGAENNKSGNLGTCPRCSIIPVRVISPETDGALFSTVADGIIWAADNGADIISMSLGGTGGREVLDVAVSYARNKGKLLVASAGNFGDTYPVTPASIPGVIGVAAHDQDGKLYGFSSRGSANATFSAPSCMEATDSRNRVTTYCGTSSSAPFVAGILGLLLSANRNIDAEAVLAHTATSTRGVRHGKVNAHRALLVARGKPAATNVPRTCGFRDIPANAYYARAACWMKQEKITTGFGGSTTRFAPRERVTRAQMAAFLWRTAGRPKAPTTCGFRDVPTNAYYARAACWMKQEAITTGFGGDTRRFAPREQIDRDQLAAFLWRAAGMPPGFAHCGFRDVPTNAYYAQGACWLKANNITTGFGGDTHRFAPLEKVTRAQMAAFLWRLQNR